MSFRRSVLVAPLLLLPIAALSADRTDAPKNEIWAEANIVWRNGPVSVKTLANMPVLIGSPSVPYPELARQSHVSGQVCLEVNVNERGRVDDVHAVCGPPMLRVFAEHKIRQWRYKPAQADGQPVKAKGYILLNFQLDE